MALQGGKFLSSGTYGCVVSPSLIDKSPKKVSKVIVAKDATKEAAEALRMRKADPQGKYGVYPIGSIGQPPKDAMLAERELINCNSSHARPHIKKFFESGKVGELRTIEYERGTSDLEAALVPANAAAVMAYLRGVLNLLHGLEVYHRNHLYHLDIKPPNVIVIGPMNNPKTLKFIDFGLAASSDIKEGHPACWSTYMFYHPACVLALGREKKDEFLRNYVSENNSMRDHMTKRYGFPAPLGNSTSRVRLDAYHNWVDECTRNMGTGGDRKSIALERTDVCGVGMVLFNVLAKLWTGGKTSEYDKLVKLSNNMVDLKMSATEAAKALKAILK